MKTTRKKENKKDIQINEIYEIVNKLMKEDKIKFRFYKDQNDSLELLQLLYNNKNNSIEFEFRNKTKDYLNELKEIINKEIKMK